jgi:predicted pyridoxine 5'-phosphate oxidase superfamily flavin-nucleotide-binding protein
MSSQPHQLDSVDAIREIVGEPNPATPLKVMDALDEMATAFIRRSPFLVLATAGRDGLPDMSPKGDEPGFVAVARGRPPVASAVDPGKVASSARTQTADGRDSNEATRRSPPALSDRRSRTGRHAR